ncbi:MAG: Ribosomal silencing factor RsfS [Phycisphaerae bacterium]|nr:Ribosomal silencing factor RsfS [Phycisphaerae bacterium]
MQKPRGVEISADDADQIDEALDFAVEAARVAAESRTEQVLVLDLRGLSGIADFFVIGTGSSDRQMRAVADLIEKHARSVGRRPYRVADSAAASWILADYVDVVVHLFDQKHRRYYDLDSLWGDAPRIDWTKSDDEPGEPPAPAD